MLKKLVIDISKIVNGTVIAQLLPLIALPFFARLYSPEAFANFALFFASSAIGSIILSLRTETGIISSTSEEELAQNTLLALIFTAVLFVFAALGVFALQLFFQLPNFVFPALFTSFLLALFNIHQNVLVWHESFGEASKLIIIKSVLVVTLTLLFSFEYNGQVWGFALANLLITAAVMKPLLKISRNTKASSVKTSLIKNKNNIFYLAPHTLYNNFILQGPIYILSIYFPATQVGQYSMANRLIAAPISFISSACNKVLFKKFSTLEHQKNTKTQQFLMKKLTLSLFFLLGLFFSILYLFGESLITYILGPNWLSTYPIIVALLPWLLLRSIAGAFAFITILKEKQKNALLFELVYGFVSLSILYTQSQYNNLLHTVSAFAITGAIFVSIQLAWYFSLLRHTNET
ncbi:lipopolysaccharide biosynthesis protein [Pseudoalteromonas piratica]|uniref:Polysaccharide biosynthesis protein n=1 Tax=Pseudoalteromonas piratica TaxID=1348114 RepID=A0A0A7EDB2_9GAMM|nr:oligosaccharide flippase family protein [Pseudoalteromonas piratica]AIY64574.1 hypothetical protein OM33_04985 [Pseudoalteromonas piratica]